MAFLDNKNCVSYLQKSKREIWVYSTEEHLFLTNGFALFRVEHDRRLSFYEPPEKNIVYVKQEGKDGAFLESSRSHPMTIWDKFMNEQERVHEVVATNFCYQVDEKLFIRKFVSGDKKHTVWIKKDITDTLEALACDLNNRYQFELKEKSFLRVNRRSFYTGEQPRPLAIFMPYCHEEKD